MTGTVPIRVLVADDHPVVRAGLTAAIGYQTDMCVVGQASNGDEAIALFYTQIPDVTLMDLRMPIRSGVEAIRSIRDPFPAARIIVLTTYDGDEDIQRALRAGASGYLLKETPMEEVLEAIRAVHRGRKWISSDVAIRLAEHVGEKTLTRREIEVLELIARGSSNQMIAASLHIVEGTVKAHVSNILSKLDAADRTQAVTEGMRRGILHIE